MNKHLAPILTRIRTQTFECSADEIVESVRANVELILNTRLSLPQNYRLRATDAEEMERLNNSLVNFGVAEFQSLNLGDASMENRFCKSVRIAVERYEPRLQKVRIAMSTSTRQRLVNVEVRAELAVKPFDTIRFETGVSPDLQQFVVN